MEIDADLVCRPIGRLCSQNNSKTISQHGTKQISVYRMFSVFRILVLGICAPGHLTDEVAT